MLIWHLVVIMSNIGVIKMLQKNLIIKFRIVIIEEGIEDIELCNFIIT